MNSPESPPLHELLERIRHNDASAVGELFTFYRERLMRMISLRLDRRLQGRVDASDVLQEAFLDIVPRAAELAVKPDDQFYLWLRLITGERLLKIHRQHLQTQMRDVSQEVSICGGAMPSADAISLAGLLLASLTSPSGAVVKAEQRLQLQQALDQMDSIDREIIALRHFEELSNGEVAIVLNLSKTAASNRYIRAIKRLKSKLSQFPGFR